MVLVLWRIWRRSGNFSEVRREGNRNRCWERGGKEGKFMFINKRETEEDSEF